MNRSFHFYSDNGDEYKLSLSDDDGLNLYNEVSEKYGLSLINVELARVKGNSVTSVSILSSIEEQIADTFMDYPDSILVYYCDFLNPVPSTRSVLHPQEYHGQAFAARISDCFRDTHSVFQTGRMIRRSTAHSRREIQVIDYQPIAQKARHQNGASLLHNTLSLSHIHFTQKISGNHNL